MQLEPGCLKEINIDKAGFSQSAVDAVIVEGECPEIAQLLGERSPVVQAKST